MNIDRNNYEEYFLLYADNELTDSEKTEVLMFLKENKDLEEEFRMIHHTICKPDVNVEFEDKSFLLRGKTQTFINEKNYEEIFVLYHDDELTTEQKKETGDFLFHHPKLKNEFELIGLARLRPENSLVFPNKKKLLRKEEPGKVVPVMFWRALVAAAFIGSGIWITQLYIQKGKEGPAAALQSGPAKHSAPVVERNPVGVKKSNNTLVQSSVRNPQTAGAQLTHKKGKLPGLLTRKNRVPELVHTSLKTKKQTRDNVAGQPLEKINTGAVALNEKIKNITGEQIPEDNAMESSKELTRNAIQAHDNVPPVTHVSNSSDVSDPGDNGQNYVFYDITTEEFKKTKIGGFLKKVKRVIERNNPISRLLSGDDRQVVSN